ncbi:MAG: UDPglucose--hexose-phosphate uridylyltransferase [Actinomycetota bacterium]|jgi:UDPglucose--hexose-1-phosphate uridylyltransferase|nr:UDPglucose--hexose-phosphate uridylyltransferase [Actinomycetota bacterium]
MERRRDPLTGQWRVFAGHRQDRTFLPPPDQCPLCPTRPGGLVTEIHKPSFDIAVFDNRFPSLVASPPPPSVAGTDLYAVAPAAGACEVVVYSDDHEATFAGLGRERTRLVIDTWAERYTALGARPEVAYVFIFENKGEEIGVTLSHPHGQIYGYPEIPPIPRLELEAAAAAGRCVLCDVVAAEVADDQRAVTGNDSFVAFVPFAPRFPYEVHIASRVHRPSLVDLDDGERDDLAGVLETVTRTYDLLWGFSLPYVMAVHQAPTDGGDWSAASHLHVEFTPIHRSATKLKYLAGSELGAGAFISDVAPEQAAAELRARRP